MNRLLPALFLILGLIIGGAISRSVNEPVAVDIARDVPEANTLDPSTTDAESNVETANNIDTPTSGDIAVPSRESARGDGSIRGRVVRGWENVPIEGARVFARPHVDDAQFDPLGEEDYVAALVNQLEWRDQPFETVSDADGRFVLEGLANREWSITAEHEAYSFGFGQWRTGFLRWPGGDELELRGQPAGRVVVQVEGLDENGGGGQVELHSPNSHFGNNTRRYTIEGPFPDGVAAQPGPYLVRYVGPGSRSEDVEVEVVAGEETSVTLTVAPSTTIRGRLLDADGQLLSGFEVVAAVGDVDLAPDRRSYGGPKAPLVARSFARGHYSLDGLEPGTYTLGISKQTLGRRQFQNIARVEASAGINEVDLTVPAPDGIRVTLRESNGDRIVFSNWGIAPNVRILGGERTRGSNLIAMANDFYLVPDEKIAATIENGTAVLVAKIGNTRLSRPVPLEPGADSIEVWFDDPSTLTVRVLEASGEPTMTPRLRFGIERVEESRTTNYGMSSGTGIFARQNPKQFCVENGGVAGPFSLGAGDYVLQASIVSSNAVGKTFGLGLPVVRETLAVLPGESREVTLALPPLQPVSFQFDDVPDSPENTLVIRQSDRGRSVSLPIVHGVATLDRVPNGEYLACLSLDGEYASGGTMPFTVRGPTTLSFQPRVPIGYVVRIRDRASELWSLGLRDGDLIVGVDGPFELTEKGRLPRLRKLKDKRLLIDRGGTRTEVTVEVDGLPTDDDNTIQVQYGGPR